MVMGIVSGVFKVGETVLVLVFILLGWRVIASLGFTGILAFTAPIILIIGGAVIIFNIFKAKP